LVRDIEFDAVAPIPVMDENIIAVLLQQTTTNEFIPESGWLSISRLVFIQKEPQKENQSK
jgi:hypothetical protein